MSSLQNCFGKQISNQHWAIRRELESVGPTLLKNLLGAGWSLPPTLRWVGSWLLIYLTSFYRQVEKISQRNRPANHFIRKWVPLHYHPVV